MKEFDTLRKQRVSLEPSVQAAWCDVWNAFKEEFGRAADENSKLQGKVTQLADMRE